MYFTKNRVFRATGFGIGLVLTATLALAGQATFTLPVEAHLGNAVLSPGDYRMSTPTAMSTIPVVYLYGNGKVQQTLPLTVGNESEPGRSYLELVNVGGAYYVTKYNAGIGGQTITFEIPKKIRREAVANLRVTSLPVNSGQGN